MFATNKTVPAREDHVQQPMRSPRTANEGTAGKANGGLSPRNDQPPRASDGGEAGVKAVSYARGNCGQTALAGRGERSGILAEGAQLRPRGQQVPPPTPTASTRSATQPSRKRSRAQPKRPPGPWGSHWLLVSLLGMAFSTLVIVVCIMLGGITPFQDAPTPTSVEAAPVGSEVTHGSLIKLMHDKTKFRLHSHDVPYGTGSGQQSVTGFPGVEDANSYWVVHLVDDEPRQGELIPDGSTVRLQHARTRKWLHSHLHQSPISGNLEVSCFGGDGQSDTGDHWRLEIEGKGDVWLRDQKVRLQHVDTGGYLHSHDKKYSRIVAGQQEVCGVTKRTSQSIWVAAEGVYFPSGRTASE